MSIQAFTSNNKGNWKANLPVLWLGVFLCCASYTMCMPFLPVYLLRELHVTQADVNFWAGITFAITFMGSAVMAPYWGALADRVGQRGALRGDRHGHIVAAPGSPGLFRVPEQQGE